MASTSPRTGWATSGPGGATPTAAARAGDKGVVTGSHLDSVPDGGAFDGPLGVVSAFAAVDALRDNGFTPRRPIGVVNFVDEEGARFGVACAGSRVITGAMTASRARGLTDADGVSMAEALDAAGRDPHQIGRDDETVGRIGAFVELHVEQGRGLIDLDHAVAVGTDIWPHGRWRLDFPGEANHAGTTRLEDRHDAMLGFAGAVLAAREAAVTHGCVATVGKVAVTPGGVNAVPSAVTGWLDARGASPRAVRRAVTDVDAHGRAVRWPRRRRSRGRRRRPSTTTCRRASPPGSAAYLRSAPVRGTTRASSRTPACPPRCCSCATPPGSRTRLPSIAELADCLEGVEALTKVLEDLAGEQA